MKTNIFVKEMSRDDDVLYGFRENLKKLYESLEKK